MGDRGLEDRGAGVGGLAQGILQTRRGSYRPRQWESAVRSRQRHGRRSGKAFGIPCPPEVSTVSAVSAGSEYQCSLLIILTIRVPAGMSRDTSSPDATSPPKAQKVLTSSARSPQHLRSASRARSPQHLRSMHRPTPVRPTSYHASRPPPLPPGAQRVKGETDGTSVERPFRPVGTVSAKGNWVD